ncbi:MAG: hypothetical protein Q3962_03050 [Corynebacterium sp.]|nr:hypothetical protein [Corynebacterium sp.]
MKKFLAGVIAVATLSAGISAPAAHAEVAQPQAVAQKVADPFVNPYAVPVALLVVVGMLTYMYQSNFSS